MNHYETALPEGYLPDKTVDADKDKRFIVRMNVAAFLVLLVSLPAGLGLLLLLKRPSLTETGRAGMTWVLLGFIAVMLAYIVLHELTHGAAYKLFAPKEKLRFGMTLTVAFCGMPQLYCRRRMMLVSVLAPFAVYTAVFAGAVVLSPANLISVLCLVLLCIHWSGCVGDLYVAWLLLTRYRDKDVLVNDNGPTQVFYLKQDLPSVATVEKEA